MDVFEVQVALCLDLILHVGTLTSEVNTVKQMALAVHIYV